MCGIVGLFAKSPEIEEALVSHPDVLEAAVIGVQSELSEEDIKAFVRASGERVLLDACDLLPDEGDPGQRHHVGREVALGADQAASSRFLTSSDAASWPGSSAFASRAKTSAARS